MHRVIGLLLVLFALAACTQGGTGGSNTGPTTNVSVFCESTTDTGGGSQGGTTINTDVDCPDNSGNTTTTPPVP